RAGMVKSEAHSLDDSLPVYSVLTLESMLADEFSQRRFAVILLGLFAALALVLAAVGLYGVMAYVVSQRTREIGIRMAMGARPGDVLRLVVGQGMALTLIGIAVGLAGSLVLKRFLAGFLFGVSATDPVTYGGVALLLAGVALAASYAPARRATHVDPLEALRYE
ncbi:MAG: FtsX-like permease family protein, partial [Terriglobia bacterium]